MSERVILERLLQKYEGSKHLLEPGRSHKRVMLRTDKKELPEYDYENAQVRDSFNSAARNLEGEGLLTVEWGNPMVFTVLALNLEPDALRRSYERLGRLHPGERAVQFCRTLWEGLESVSADWILAWQEAVCREAATKYRLPGFCREDFSQLQDLLTAFRAYDSLRGEPVTMRTFSSWCYHDTKYFERNVRTRFLKIAARYDRDLAEAMEQTEMQTREQQAFLGIYARPELYELAGSCAIVTAHGRIDVGAAGPFGLALPSTAVDSVKGFDLAGIHRIIFIENKTNYDEFLLTELEPDMLVLYHGGFLSPQKRKLAAKLGAAAGKDIPLYFWADIDLGGFRMFTHLQQILPELQPMRMGGQEVRQYQAIGLKREKAYLTQLQRSLDRGEFPAFAEAIRAILACGVTIEQECFLG